MTLCFQPDEVVWRTFRDEETNLLAPHANAELMADYLQAFFHSHHDTRQPEPDTLLRWLNSEPHRFSAMALALLPELQARRPVISSQLDMVVLAHWTPDSELGCAVTNALIHACDAPQAFGFSVSDRAQAAPLFALHTINEYLGHEAKATPPTALLMIADQARAPYTSDALAALAPQNTGCLIRLEARPPEQASGLVFEGYYRQPYEAGGPTASTLASLLEQITPSPLSGADDWPLTLVASPSLLAAVTGADESVPTLALPEALLCAAPFVSLKQQARPGGRYLLVVPEIRHLTACILRYQPDGDRQPDCLPPLG
ncbi:MULTISPECIES: hypothetical protein [Dickeya]|uniref:Uncharacterized protein n=1 Tax=Dickeya aquatica TaxID=1401087 RepID=A0A375AGN1_9GAMM|nr:MULTISPECIES: hypothetical protein [Dickeya]SLM65066.1 FIG00614026: hypothetical protein [Dickeya aquatica]